MYQAENLRVSHVLRTAHDAVEKTFHLAIDKVERLRRETAGRVNCEIREIVIDDKVI